MKKRYQGKYAQQSRDLKPGAAALLICAAILAVVLLVLWGLGYFSPKPVNDPADNTDRPQQNELPIDTQKPADEQQPDKEEKPTDPEDQVEITLDQFQPINLGQGLSITDMGSYVGMYMEDGSDEIVSGIHMIVVKNDGETSLQYGEIQLTRGGETANFTVTTLPAGASVVLLETERKPYTESDLSPSAVLRNAAFFQEEPSMHEDVFEITGMDGALNVKNISDRDVSGDICVYYKNSASDLYYGGITYLARVTGGLKAGEIKQVMTNHYTASGSALMMVTFPEA